MKTIEIFLQYLREHIKAIVSFIIFTGTLCFTFFLYRFPMESILYAFLVAFLPIFILFLYDFIKYRRRLLEILAVKEFLIDGLAGLDFAGGRIEKEFADVINGMNSSFKKIKLNQITKQREADEYYSMWVHQIKTPIAAMKLLLQQDSSAEASRLKQELFKIEKYVDMVLGFLRIHSNVSDLSFGKVRVHDVLKEAVKVFAPIFIYKQIGIELSDFSNEIISDRKWLLFVIEQLLSNALKYTDAGSIKIYMNEDDVLFIEDTGRGISPEDLPRIFEKGYTGYNGRVNRTSTGIGLYLCRLILDKLGSEIEITSVEGKGTTVKLFLHRHKLVSND